MQGWIVENEARRVVLEQRCRSELGAELLFLVRAESLVIAVHRHDVVETAEKPRSVRHAFHRLVIAQCAIIRIRIGVEIRWKLRQVEASGNLWSGHGAYDGAFAGFAARDAVKQSSLRE